MRGGQTCTTPQPDREVKPTIASLCKPVSVDQRSVLYTCQSQFTHSRAHASERKITFSVQGARLPPTRTVGGQASEASITMRSRVRHGPGGAAPLRARSRVPAPAAPPPSSAPLRGRCPAATQQARAALRAAQHVSANDTRWCSALLKDLGSGQGVAEGSNAAGHREEFRRQCHAGQRCLRGCAQRGSAAGARGAADP